MQRMLCRPANTADRSTAISIWIHPIANRSAQCAGHHVRAGSPPPQTIRGGARPSASPPGGRHQVGSYAEVRDVGLAGQFGPLVDTTRAAPWLLQSDRIRPRGRCRTRPSHLRHPDHPPLHRHLDRDNAGEYAPPSQRREKTRRSSDARCLTRIKRSALCGRTAERGWWPAPRSR
jgi:hypothetical protein